MDKQCQIHLSRDGDQQMLRIPSEFQLPSNEVTIRKENQCLIVEPVNQPSLLNVLATLPELNEDFPDVDEGLTTLEEIEL